MGNMVQYSVWSNCCNNCDFCLRRERIPYSREKQLLSLRSIRKNLDYVDWQDKFSDGISLLGGELYYIEDKELQDEFLLLIDDIIEKVLKASPNPNVKYSTVTNGLYNPEFLYKVIDKIVSAVGINGIIYLSSPHLTFFAFLIVELTSYPLVLKSLTILLSNLKSLLEI